MSNSQINPLSGKHILLTGATSGIGFETARYLARCGPVLILACRNQAKARAVRAQLQWESGNQQIVTLPLDVASLTSIRQFTAECTRRYDHLDMLINNAGGFSLERKETVDGFEQTMGTNYFGPFLLTKRLLPLLKAAPRARIINVSSDGHYYGKLDLDDLQFTRSYDSMGAYGGSKLALQFFTQELAERLQGTAVTVNALHPGHIYTNIWNLWPHPKWYHHLFDRILQVAMMDVVAGAQTTIYLATSAAVEGVTGQYFAFQRRKDPAKICADRAMQQRLWALTETLVGA